MDLRIRNAAGELWSPPIAVDFNKGTRVPLGTYRQSQEVLASLTLHVGMRLVVFDYDATEVEDPDDLITVGIAEFEPRTNEWFARIDAGELWHRTDLDDEDQSAYGPSHG